MRRRFRNINYSTDDVEAVSKIGAIDTASFYTYPSFKLRTPSLREYKKRNRKKLLKENPRKFKKTMRTSFDQDRKMGRELADNHKLLLAKAEKSNFNFGFLLFILFIVMTLFLALKQ
jgi:hypothetical protein